MPTFPTKLIDHDSQPQSPLYGVVALYGLDCSAAVVESLYRFAMEWLSNHGCSPFLLGVGGEGFPKRAGAFNRLNRRLEERGFERVSAIELHSTMPSLDSQNTIAAMCAACSLEGQYALFSAELTVCPLRDLIATAKASTAIVCPQYGIGFFRKRRFAPAWYAIGINGYWEPVFSGPKYEERVRTTKWRRAMQERVYLQGILRDVYPYNFLTEPQLTRKVGAMPLRDWIAEDSSRGELSHFAGDVWLWSVPDEQIPTIRDELRQHGIIFGLKPDR